MLDKGLPGVFWGVPAGAILECGESCHITLTAASGMLRSPGEGSKLLIVNNKQPTITVNNKQKTKTRKSNK